MNGKIEIRKQHHKGKQQYAFGREKEEKSLAPLFDFFPVEEHASHHPIEPHLQQEIAQDGGGEDADDLVLLNDERVADERPEVEEKDDGKEQTGLHDEEELRPELA